MKERSHRRLIQEIIGEASSGFDASPIIERAFERRLRKEKEVWREQMKETARSPRVQGKEAGKIWSCGDIHYELMNDLGGSLIEMVADEVQKRVDTNVELAVRDYVKEGFLTFHEDRPDMTVAFYSADPIEAVFEMSFVELLEKDLGFHISDDETIETALFDPYPYDAETMAELGSTAEKEAARSANLKKLRECWRILKAP